MAVPGISTLGVKLGYAAESTKDVKPTAFKQLTRINSIGEIALETNTIDASALEDFVTKSIAGRQDAGGSFDVVVNLTDETKTEWQTLISEYNALTDGKQIWFEVWSPGMEDAFFIVAQPPQVLPMPAYDQDGLLTVTIGLAIADFKGLDTGIEPTA